MIPIEESAVQPDTMSGLMRLQVLVNSTCWVPQDEDFLINGA